MKPAPFAYTRPTSLTDALDSLAGASDAKVLAGGQSLVPLLSMRLAAPAQIVDINGLPGLDGIDVTPDGVRVGALARHADVLASDPASQVQPLLRLGLSYVAHPTIRNRGTTVGSLVHADAAAEMPVVLRLVGGSVDVVSVRGTRTIAADELFLGPLESSLAPDEIAVSAYFPALPPGSGVAFEEIARRHGDYALCGVAAVVAVAGGAGAGGAGSNGSGVDGRVVDARVGYLSVADLPTVVDVTDTLADGPSDGLTDRALDAAVEVALAELDPAEDIHATAAYRAQLVRVLTSRVLRSAYDDARGGHDRGAA